MRLERVAGLFTQMASNTELRQAFRAFDANGDNTISEAEFIAVLTRPLPGQPAHFTAPQAKARFKQVDVDGSGSVEYEECAPRETLKAH